MNFIEACKPYWYKGTMTLSPTPWCYEDNPHYFTAWFFRIARQLTHPQPVIPEWWNYANHLTACLTKYGIPDRDPVIGRYEKISHDELVGVAYLHPAVTAMLIVHAQKHRWSVDNRTGEFSWKTWLPKSLYAPAFICARAGARIPLWAKLLYAIDCITTVFKPWGNTSGKLQLLLVSDTMLSQDSSIIKLATRFFLRGMKRTYGKWDGLFTIYFKPTHPFTEAVKGWEFI
jgi:hypothetical protein